MTYKRFIQLLFVIGLPLTAPGFVRGQAAAVPFVAGFRASRILSNYPNRQFPNADYWIHVGNEMSSRFSTAGSAGIWIVSLYQSNGVTQFNFPSDGRIIPYVNFIGTDQNEAYLSQFDAAGLKVWLQVEPGAASVDTLIDIVLNRYKHHSCVAGFGVDVEWYYAHTDPGGRKLTDAEVQRWEGKVRSVDTNYTIFLKHYAQRWMPPIYRGTILFIDDSQGFSSLASMVSEFKAWGVSFTSNRVAFQLGYKIDTTWWKQYADPASTIGHALRSEIPNLYGIFWVDFTINTVFPITPVAEIASGPVPSNFVLEQNFPNPFNPTTVIRFQIPSRSHVTLSIFDAMGRTVAELLNQELTPGNYQKEWRADVASGIYFCRMNAIPVDILIGRFKAVKQMIHLK